MKKSFLCALIIFLVFCLLGCANENASDIEENTTVAQTTSKSNNKENIVSLENACGAGNIDFDADYVEISVWSDSIYCFSNRNEDFCLAMTEFLKNTKVNSVQANEAVSEKNYYIAIHDNENHANFFVYDTDVISIVDLGKVELYYCKGIYDSFEKTFGTFWEENNKYYSTESLYDTSKYDVPTFIGYSYTVFDKDYNILESDSTTKTPHMYYNSGIVHLWIQTGTGHLTRFAKFFDVENGRISPEYYGQTDFFENMVISTGNSKVVIFDMFSGEELFSIKKFEKPLGDCLENIQSAYFSKDGKQIIVRYLNEKFETETQIFDLPKLN